ncbi:hypothetical protein LSAT2_017216 [Lamellibrachia satsuma]|nr:hypothetical protein LSAT2_017216 [Lamellibrachia satsuma]
MQYTNGSSLNSSYGLRRHVNNTVEGLYFRSRWEDIIRGTEAHNIQIEFTMVAIHILLILIVVCTPHFVTSKNERQSECFSDGCYYSCSSRNCKKFQCYRSDSVTCNNKSCPCNYDDCTCT